METTEVSSPPEVEADLGESSADNGLLEEMNELRQVKSINIKDVAEKMNL